MVSIENGLNYMSSFLYSVIANLLIYNARTIWQVYGQEQNVGTANVSTLRMVHMLYRHGDRSATRNYPTDNHTEEDWPQGYGQLSQIGMRQHYDLGKSIKQRYQGFLSNHYNRSEIYIRSTDFDRTLMSAYSHLAGFFPPQGKQKWNSSLLWQPIPVHTVPQPEDYLMRLDNCPGALNITDADFEDSERIRKAAEKKYKLFTEYIANHSGLEANVDSAASVHDIVFCEMNHNMSQPSWVLKNGTLEQLLELRILNFNLSYPSKVSKRLSGGPLLKEFISHMQKYIDKNLNVTQKLFMYSGHDSTLIALMKVLNVYQYYYSPHYTAVLIIELHEKTTQHFSVEVYFKNGLSDPKLHLLTVPGCKSSCPLSEFVSLTKDMIPVDVMKECGLSAEQSFPAKSLVAGILLGCLVALIIVITSALGVIYWKHKQKEKMRYHPLATDNIDDDEEI